MTSPRGGLGPGAGLAAWLSGSKQREEFAEYQRRGGDLSFDTWLRQGKPKALVSAQPEWLTPRTREIMGRPAYAEAEAARQVGLPIPSKEGAVTPKETVTTPTAGLGEQIPPPNNVSEWYDREGTRWVWNGIDKYIQAGFDESKIYQSPETQTAYQTGQLELQRAQMEQQRLQDEALMGWYQQQAAMQQQEQERQYRSQLMANPMSWLQYSSYTGQAPVVQEWMKPLMSGQYQTGQQIPGWMGGQAGVQGEGQPMGSLPELRTPSAQLWGRMGPTAQAQYMGYGQARTGIRPEETMFRLGASAPPSGRFGGLRRMR